MLSDVERMIDKLVVEGVLVRIDDKEYLKMALAISTAVIVSALAFFMIRTLFTKQ